MAEYPSSPLGELTELITKGTTPTTDGGGFASSGINFIKVESVSPDGSLIPSKFAYVDEPTHKTLLRSQLKEDDLLFSIAGTIGRTAIVTAEDLPANTNQALAIIRCRPDQILPRFLLYALRDGKRIQSAQSRVVQSVQANFSLRELGELEVPLPTLPEQRAIAEVLGALDDKIESNRRIVQSVMELIPLELRIAQTDEWPSVPLDSIARFVNGGAYTKGASGNGRMVIRIAELNGGPGSSTVYNDIEVPDEKTARPGDLLMSWSGSLDMYFWSLPEAIINQHIFKVICTEFPAWFVHCRIKEVLPEFQQTAADKATTMGHIKREHLHQAEVQVPAADEMKILDAKLDPLWERMAVAEAEQNRLAEMRDALLPALLSGRIRVPVAAELVEAS